MKPPEGVHWPIGHFKFRSLPPSPRARRVLRYVNGELKNLLQCQEIPNLVTDALGPYGIQTAFIGRYLSHGDQKNSDESSPILIASNTDPQSQEFYFAQSWQLSDLRVRLGNVIARPFLWHEISHIGSQQLIYKKAAEFGMNTGICLPGNARGRTGGIVLSAQKLQSPDELLEICAIISQPVFDRAVALADNLPLNEPQLSIREREIILCIARGMTNIEISKHICLSISSVKHIISEIGKKTDTTRREQLVLCGVHLGLIY